MSLAPGGSGGIPGAYGNPGYMMPVAPGAMSNLTEDELIAAELAQENEALDMQRAAAEADTTNLYNDMHKGQAIPIEHRMAASVGHTPEETEKILRELGYNPMPYPSGDNWLLEHKGEPGNFKAYRLPWSGGPAAIGANLASVLPEAAEMAGGTAAAAAGLFGAGPIAAAGAFGVGSQAAREAYRRYTQSLTGIDETRAPGEVALDAGQGAVLNAVLPPVVDRVVRPFMQGAAGLVRGAAAPFVGRGGRPNSLAPTVEALNESALPGNEITRLTAADMTGSPTVAAWQSAFAQLPGGGGLRASATGAGEQVAARSEQAAAAGSGPRFPTGGAVGERAMGGATKGVAEWETKREALDAAAQRLIGEDRPVPVWQLRQLKDEWESKIGQGRDAVRPFYETGMAKLQSLLGTADSKAWETGPPGYIRWDVLRQARTQLGKQLEWPGLGAQFEPGEEAMGQLYAVLTRMIDREAMTAGPVAHRAMQAHDAFVTGFREPGGAADFLRRYGKEGMQENRGATMLRSDALEGGRGIEALRQHMPAGEWREMMAGMIHDFGNLSMNKSRPRAEWDPAQFAAGWNKMLQNPRMVRMMENDPQLSRQIADWQRIADIGGNMANTRTFGNTSGTSGTLTLLGILGTAGMAVAGGAPATGLGAAGLTLGGGAIGSRLFQSPRFVRWMAGTAGDAAERGLPGVSARIGELVTIAKQEDDKGIKRALYELHGKLSEAMRADRGMLPKGATPNIYRRPESVPMGAP